VTALALIAFLRSGAMSENATYQRAAISGLAFLKRQQDDMGPCKRVANAHGCFEADAHSLQRATTFAHAAATIAMAEAFALTDAAVYRTSAESALGYIAAMHNDGSGWGYATHKEASDLFVTFWMAMALRTARDVGLSAPMDEFADAAALARLLTDRASGIAGYRVTGGVGEQVQGSRGIAHPSMTAAAIVVRLLAREPRDQPLLRRSAELLVNDLPTWDVDSDRLDFLYWYMGSAAMTRMGGGGADRWVAAAWPTLVRHQRTIDDGDLAGSWDPEVDPWGDAGGRVYATAINAMTLELLGPLPPIR
jgi:hypothetical protein